jgi:hypothetical protein
MKPLRLRKTVVIAVAALIFIGVALTVATSALLQTQQNRQNLQTNSGLGGTAVNSLNIGVYEDPAATINCANINWGNITKGIAKGSTIQRIVYIKNTSNETETLNMTSANWNPPYAKSVLSLSWDKEGIALFPKTIVPATLTLTVPEDTNTLNSFTFNILISGKS